MAHLLWAIFHVEYDGRGPLAIRDDFGQSRYKVRSRPGKKVNFNIFNFGKQRHVSYAECPQESNGAIVFSMWARTPKNRVLLYDFTIIHGGVS